jgi:hypothetical protein
MSGHREPAIASGMVNKRMAALDMLHTAMSTEHILVTMGVHWLLALQQQHTSPASQGNCHYPCQGEAQLHVTIAGQPPSAQPLAPAK